MSWRRGLAAQGRSRAQRRARRGEGAGRQRAGEDEERLWSRAPQLQRLELEPGGSRRPSGPASISCWKLRPARSAPRESHVHSFIRHRSGAPTPGLKGRNGDFGSETPRQQPAWLGPLGFSPGGSGHRRVVFCC